MSEREKEIELKKQELALRERELALQESKSKRGARLALAFSIVMLVIVIVGSIFFLTRLMGMSAALADLQAQLAASQSGQGGVVGESVVTTKENPTPTPSIPTQTFVPTDTPPPTDLPTDTPMPSSTPTATPSPTPSATPSITPSPSPIASVRHQDFLFEAYQCVDSGGKVDCDFIITNLADDRVLYIWHYAEIYDNFNNQYESENVSLGNKSTESTIDLLLVSNIPTKCRVTFEEVTPEASKIVLLRLSVRINNDPYEDIEFRDIPITRRP